MSAEVGDKYVSEPSLNVVCSVNHIGVPDPPADNYVSGPSLNAPVVCSVNPLGAEYVPAPPADTISELVFHRRHDLLCASSWDCTVRLWTIGERDAPPLLPLDIHRLESDAGPSLGYLGDAPSTRPCAKAVDCVFSDTPLLSCVFAGRDTVCVGGVDGSVSIASIEKAGEELQLLGKHKGMAPLVKVVAHVPHLSSILSSSLDGSIHLWDSRADRRGGIAVKVATAGSTSDEPSATTLTCGSFVPDHDLLFAYAGHRTEFSANELDEHSDRSTWGSAIYPYLRYIDLRFAATRGSTASVCNDAYPTTVGTPLRAPITAMAFRQRPEGPEATVDALIGSYGRCLFRSYGVSSSPRAALADIDSAEMPAKYAELPFVRGRRTKSFGWKCHWSQHCLRRSLIWEPVRYNANKLRFRHRINSAAFNPSTGKCATGGSAGWLDVWCIEQKRRLFHSTLRFPVPVTNVTFSQVGGLVAIGLGETGHNFLEERMENPMEDTFHEGVATFKKRSTGFGSRIQLVYDKVVDRICSVLHPSKFREAPDAPSSFGPQS